MFLSSKGMGDSMQNLPDMADFSPQIYGDA